MKGQSQLSSPRTIDSTSQADTPLGRSYPHVKDGQQVTQYNLCDLFNYISVVTMELGNQDQLPLVLCLRLGLGARGESDPRSEVRGSSMWSVSEAWGPGRVSTKSLRKGCSTISFVF